MSMKEFIFSLIISICLLYVTFQTGRRVGVTETNKEVTIQQCIDVCEVTCEEQFEKMGC